MLTRVMFPESAQFITHNNQVTGYALEHNLPRQLPTVASFVPTLSNGHPFRVSIHSWESPVASKTAQSIAQQSNTIYFEARVLVDGICVRLIHLDIVDQRLRAHLTSSHQWYTFQSQWSLAASAWYAPCLATS